VYRRSAVQLHAEVVSLVECIGRVPSLGDRESSHQPRRSFQSFPVPTVRPVQRNAARYVCLSCLFSLFCLQHHHGTDCLYIYLFIYLFII